jgi:hypothetical protein
MSQQPGAQARQQNGHEPTCPLVGGSVDVRLVEPAEQHVEASKGPTRLLNPPSPERRQRWQERLGLRFLDTLGYRVSEAPASREVKFLECAPELVGAIRTGHPRFTDPCARFLSRAERLGRSRRALRPAG